MRSEGPHEHAPESAGLTRTYTSVGAPQISMGPYRLVELIGEGGMGEVWLAEQLRPVRRLVAIKVVKAGMDTAQVVARFEAERQALAVMDHPTIAKVFDGGTTPEGRPYFAMEHVKGEPITAYCDRERLPIQERLELFIQLCEGVQHAHQKGIIHRDLKPSNVLVSRGDDHPLPRIIDFGIAKALAQPLTAQPLFTEVGGLLGTPEYMSPEQAEAPPLDVDTRSDVYSLGVLLYEILVGTLPFDSVGLRESGLEEIRRTIREKTPRRPSTRVAPTGAASKAIAEHRRTQPDRLATVLRGDLDWIVMKALEKDRTRRYQTVNALALDVRRHLNHEPVSAGPPSAAYRTRKFVRRHRFGVAAGAVLAGLFLTFSLVVSVQARRIAEERDRANTEARRANAEAATANQAAEFLAALFRISDPSEARGNAITARELLDKGAGEISSALADRPDVQARLLTTMGTAYIGLGLYPAAEKLLRNAVLSSRRLGDDHETTLHALHALANVHWYQNRHSEAERLYRTVVEARRRTLGDDHRDTLKAKYDLASTYLRQNRYEEGEKLTQETLERQRRVLGAEHEDTLASLGNLAWLYDKQRRYAEAAAVNAQVLDLMRQKLGPLHPETLITMNNLAVNYEGLGRWKEAEALFKETITVKRRVQGETHDSTVLTIRRLAGLYRRTGQLAEAEQQLIPLATSLLRSAAINPETANAVVSDLVKVYEEWNKPGEASRWRLKHQ